MSESTVLEIGTECFKIALFLAGPMLLAAMVIGIIVSILQAVTQINENTLTFIPKIVAIAVVMAVMAPWMLKMFEDYATGVFGNLGAFLR